MKHFKTYQEFNESKKSRMMKSLIGKDKKKSQKDARKYDKKRREDEESPEDLEFKAAAKMQKESVNEGGMDELDALAQDSKDLESFKKDALKEFPKFKGKKGTDEWLEGIYKMANESVNENKHRYIDIKDLHFEMDPDVQDEMKLEIGSRTGGITRKERIDNADYDLKRFRKKIKYWDGNKRDEDFAVGVFAGPDHYNTVHSTLGGGPHAKIIKPKRWNQKLYDKWIEDMASGEGWKHSFDMAQNATHEPGLTAWVKKTYRERNPLQRIQWDIEALGESVNEAKDKVDVASLSIGNTYKDNKGYPVKVIDIKGTGSRWKITYQYEDGKKKTVSTSLDKGINLYESEVNEAVISLPGFVLLAIGAALATRIGFMSDEKLQRGIDVTKATAKAIVKELPIIGKKIKKKEFDQSQADDIQKYLKDELSDQDIVDILMKNPDIKQSIINLSNGDGTYRYYYQVIRELGGAQEYGSAHKKFKALRKKLADGEIEVKESIKESLLNESLKSKYGSVYTDLQEDLTKPQQFYWAMHADLYDQLSKSKDANKEADTLSQSIKDGTRKEALQYFLDIILDGGVKKNQKIKA